MKLLNFVITTIICFQFVYQPIAIAQVWYDEPVQGISIDNTISQLKNILRSKALEGFKFLDENKNEISIDDLVRLKDKTFYLLSPDNDPRVEQFAVKVKFDISREDKVSIALNALDKNFKRSFGIQSFDIDPKDSENLAAKVNGRLKVLANSVKRSISKRGPSSASAAAVATVTIVVILIACKVAFWVGLIMAGIGLVKYFWVKAGASGAKITLRFFWMGLMTMALSILIGILGTLITMAVAVGVSANPVKIRIGDE